MSFNQKRLIHAVLLAVIFTAVLSTIFSWNIFFGYEKKISIILPLIQGLIFATIGPSLDEIRNVRDKINADRKK